MGKTLLGILQVVGTIVASAVGFAIGGPIGASIGAALFNLGWQALGLGQSVPKPETTERALKQPRPPRVSAYGRSRLYGAYVLFETASDGTAVDVYAVHDGQLDGIERHYLNDEQVTVVGGVVQQGADKRYKNNAVKFYTTTGAVPGAGFPAITALLDGIWTANHRGDGLVAMALTAASVKADDFQETYPQSAVPTPSIVARWQKCPDPDAVDPLNEALWTWTENPVRQLLHYELVRAGPRPALPKSDAGYAAALAALRSAWWDRKIAPTLQMWIDAADDCDSARALKAGGTEARYRSAVAHKHTDQHREPRAALLATFDGWMAPRADGAWAIYSGRYYEPTVSITPAEIVAYTFEGGEPDEGEAVNEIICSYISADHDYNTVETDAWRDEADIAARGKILSTTLDAQVPSYGQARALAKRLMQRKLASDRGTCTTNIAGRGVLGQRFVNLHLEEAGAVFYSGPVEVLSAKRDLRGGVTFEWVAANPNVDNWNPALEEGDPAPVGNRVAVAALDAPSIDTATAIYQADSVFLSIDAIGPNRNDLQWYARTREVGAGVWGAEAKFADTDPGSDVTLIVGPVPADTDVEVEVSYQVGDGRYSPWSAAESVDTTTAGLAPAAVSDFAVTAGVGEATIDWRNPTSTNFAYVQIYRSDTADFGDAAQVGSDIYGALGAVMQAVDTVAADDYWYWVRPYSSNDVAGELSGPIAVTVT